MFSQVHGLFGVSAFAPFPSAFGHGIITCHGGVGRGRLRALKRVIIHTDGACKGNPGPGAYGAVLVCGRHRKEISAGYRLTTNNRMELRAAIAAQ